MLQIPLIIHWEMSINATPTDHNHETETCWHYAYTHISLIYHYIETWEGVLYWAQWKRRIEMKWAAMPAEWTTTTKHHHAIIIIFIKQKTLWEWVICEWYMNYHIMLIIIYLYIIIFRVWLIFGFLLFIVWFIY